VGPAKLKSVVSHLLEAQVKLLLRNKAGDEEISSKAVDLEARDMGSLKLQRLRLQAIRQATQTIRIGLVIVCHSNGVRRIQRFKKQCYKAVLRTLVRLAVGKAAMVAVDLETEMCQACKLASKRLFLLSLCPLQHQ
jgi:hypothetical protein